MSEDGQVDYSKYALEELRGAASAIDKTKYPINYANLQAAIVSREAEEPGVKKPRVDIHNDDHSPPDISALTFGPRCPACGWKKPLFRLGSRFGRPFPCVDCDSLLNVTNIHRRLNVVLMALLVPFLAWFSFGGLDTGQKLAIAASLLILGFLEFWFTRLELIDEEIGNDGLS